MVRPAGLTLSVSGGSSQNGDGTDAGREFQIDNVPNPVTVLVVHVDCKGHAVPFQWVELTREYLGPRHQFFRHLPSSD